MPLSTMVSGSKEPVGQLRNDTSVFSSPFEHHSRKL